MSASRRWLLAAPITLAALLGAAAPAAAADLLRETVSIPQSAPRACTTQAAGSTAGVAQRSLRMAPLSGTVSATTDAASGDWDVSIFDKATGKAVSAAAGFGPDEVATGFAGGGRELLLQVCRRSGSARSAQVVVRSEIVPSAGIESRPSLVKVTTLPGQKELLATQGFDVTEHAGKDYVEVVAYGQKDLDRLTALGYSFVIETLDLVKQDIERAAADRVFASRRAAAGRASTRAAGDAVPSGRTEYRRLVDYEADMKKLVEQNPGLVKPIVLKNKTIEGRAVNGIEITKDVNVADGKPVFVQLGAHHAREWPSAEHAMEWAFELVNGVRSGDADLTKLASTTRTIVVPVVNVDGFNVSREAPVDLKNDPEFAQIPDAGLNDNVIYLVDPALNYKRRNCRLVPGVDSIPAGVCATPPFRVSGVDPNRNYGGLWGGPGASALPAYDTYRGAGPFSEPETQNVRDLFSNRQIATLITNHTFSNLILRPPGVRAQGQAIDEPALRDLGARMATKNGYANDPSYMLYDTTGGTEDWTYGTAGAFGYTFEIGPGDGEGEGFHPPFSFTINQWNNGANNGGGNRAAYKLAAENTADPAKHSRLKGTAPAGVTLRIRKDVVTETSPVEPAQTDPPLNGVEPPSPQGEKIRFPDKLESTTVVPADGAFDWAINPSQRPVTDERTIENTNPNAVRTQALESQGMTVPNDVEEIPFTLSDADATASAARVTLTSAPFDDYDITLVRKEGATEEVIGTSAGSAGAVEEILFERPKAGSYVLRVTNFAAFTEYEAKLDILEPGKGMVIPRVGLEQWTLSCEVGTTVLSTQKIAVDRGKALTGVQPCGANAAVLAAVASGKAATPRTCGSSAGFASATPKVRKGGRSLDLRFVRSVPNLVSIDIFRTSTGSTVLKNRLVARFRNLTSPKVFAPKGLADGTYFVRYAIKGARIRTDRRRATFVVRKGRLTMRPSFYSPDSCGLLASAKLEYPVFGGTTKRPLNIAVLTARKADVTVVVRKGKKAIKTFRLDDIAGKKTKRLSLSSKGLAKGDYTVTLTAKDAKGSASRRLVARKL